MKYIQVKLEDNLHKQFKRKCFDKEINMSAKIRSWIKKFVDKGE